MGRWLREYGLLIGIAAVAVWAFGCIPLYQILRSHELDWGSVPDWVTFVGVVIGFFFTAREIQQSRVARETENLLDVLNGTIDHNAKLPSGETLQVLKKVEGLSVPAAEADAKLYWAARALHLSHLNLVWRVWELAGRPDAGQAVGARFTGWERFARRVIVEPLTAAQAGTDTPDMLAAKDILTGLNEYEVMPPQFVGWLMALSRRP